MKSRRMDPTTDQTRLLTDYVTLIRDLGGAVERATSALAASSLAELQQHILEQEALCGDLRALLLAPQASVVLREQVSAEATEAGQRLAVSLRLFAALLQRSQRSLGFLAGLHRGFTSGLAPDAASRNRTLSCEV